MHILETAEKKNKMKRMALIKDIHTKLVKGFAVTVLYSPQ